MSLQEGPRGAHRQVFISYRVLDDEPPPDRPNSRGFVRFLLGQIKWELGQLGVPDTVLWLDRAQIQKGEDWSQAIRSALNGSELFIAILSKNYITSPWCERELRTMTSRVKTLGAHAGQRRIFRVDKHKVPDGDIPKSLRLIQSVTFYGVDKETNQVEEYFWRGKIRRTREYYGAVHELAVAICGRLDELGVRREPLAAPQSSPPTHNVNAAGPVVFVAKPASDMLESYRTLVYELRGAGFQVTPDPDKDLGGHGKDVRSAVLNALAEAEASIHLLGEKKGERPKGLDMDLVPMQLKAAADKAQAKPGFVRMIWAPPVLPPGTSGEAKVAPRDPLNVVERFGDLLPRDQIDGDTASRFNEFVVQRLRRGGTDRNGRGGTDRNGQGALKATRKFRGPARNGQPSPPAAN